jgi:hypothetical protein
MKKIIIFSLLAVSFLLAEKTVLANNQEVSIGELREILIEANRSSQRVFVEDFTGLN